MNRIIKFVNQYSRVNTNRFELYFFSYHCVCALSAGTLFSATQCIFTCFYFNIVHVPGSNYFTIGNLNLLLWLSCEFVSQCGVYSKLLDRLTTLSLSKKLKSDRLSFNYMTELRTGENDIVY